MNSPRTSAGSPLAPENSLGNWSSTPQKADRFRTPMRSPRPPGALCDCQVAALRMRLVPEWPIYSVLSDRPEAIGLAGRIDAVAYDGERADVVIDWKSDFDPSETDMRLHAGQVQQYLWATGASRGALVYMTPGIVRWVWPGPP